MVIIFIRKTRKPPMSTAAVIGVGSGKQLLRSSFIPLEFADKLISFPDQGNSHFSTRVWKHVVFANKCSNSRTHSRSIKQIERKAFKAFREDVDGFSISSTDKATKTISAVVDKNYRLESEVERSLEALILLQKSMLEKQWYLSIDPTKFKEFNSLNSCERTEVVRSGKPSARQRRLDTRRKSSTQNFVKAKRIAQTAFNSNQNSVPVGVESRRDHMPSSTKAMPNQGLLTHEEVVCMSKKIQNGLILQKHKSRLQYKLGYEPSAAQWAAYVNMSITELNGRIMESSIAMEDLTMFNKRLVISIARNYENMGVDLEDLIEEGLMGLRYGIKKFDSSKGFKLSTYVYSWIRQAIQRARYKNSSVVRIPIHVHERRSLIKKAKLTLEDKGMDPSIENIAETTNMSEKMVKNATQAIKKIVYLDKDCSGFKDGGNLTFKRLVADPDVENQPWVTIERSLLREDVKKLVSMTLTKREQAIIRLYYGLDTRRLTWEDISKRLGYSRERVRQLGIVSLEKLKNAAKDVELEPLY